MSDPSTSEQQIAQLKKQIADSTDQAKSYLVQLQGKIADYDKQHKLSDTAASYLQAAIDQANWSVNELKDFGQRFQDGTKDISEEVLTTGKNALASMESSLEAIETKAGEYDQKAREKASKEASSAQSTLDDAKARAAAHDEKAHEKASEGASAAKTTFEKMKSTAADYDEQARETVHDEFANAKKTLVDLVAWTRDGANSLFERITTTFEELQKEIAAGAQNAGNAASESVQDAKNAASNTAQNAMNTISDATQNTSNTVSNASQTASNKIAETDQNVTGGVGADLYNKAAELVSQGVEYVSGALQSTPTDKTATTKTVPTTTMTFDKP